MPERIVEAAVHVMEASGREGFSVRKVAREVECDVMAVLYHFENRDGLERAMADALVAKIPQLDESKPWKERLRWVASAYRDLALAFPQTFPLLQRFWVTGPADYRQAEQVNRAFVEAGLTNAQIVDSCFAWYAVVLGLASAEAGGLLRPAGKQELAEIKSLPEEEFPIIRSLLPNYRKQKAGRSFVLAVEMFIDGIERRAGAF